MHPVHGAEHGFTSEIVLEPHDPLAKEMRAVLVAGATIGAVRRVGHDRSHYLISTGLARYFAMAQKKNWKIKSAEVDRRELIKVLAVALKPQVQGNADIVLGDPRPRGRQVGLRRRCRSRRAGGRAQAAVDQGHRRRRHHPGRRAAHEKDDSWYYVSSDMYTALLPTSACEIYTPHDPAIGHGGSTPRALHAETAPRIGGDQRRESRPRRQPSRRRRRVRIPTSRLRAVAPRRRRCRPSPWRWRRALRPLALVGARRSHDRARVRADLIHAGGLPTWTDREIAIALSMGES